MTNLNTWAAERVMGWQAEDLDNSCSDPDCCTPCPMITWCKEIDNEFGDKMWAQAHPDILDLGDWNPSEDRNHLAMVLEKVAPALGSAGKRKVINTLVADHMHTEYTDCGARELFRLLTAPPEIILKAVYDAVEGGGNGY